MFLPITEGAIGCRDSVALQMATASPTSSDSWPPARCHWAPLLLVWRQNSKGAVCIYCFVPISCPCQSTAWDPWKGSRRDQLIRKRIPRKPVSSTPLQKWRQRGTFGLTTSCIWKTFHCLSVLACLPACVGPRGGPASSSSPAIHHH